MIKFMGTAAYWSVDADIRVNTINCVGAMGKGIALDFKKRYPGMFQSYASMCREDKIKPGTIWQFSYPRELFTGPAQLGLSIWNAATKDHWHDPSNYDWIERILQEMKWRLTGVQQSVVVTIPALGCGNGGLCWSAVAESICKNLVDLHHCIHIFNPKNGEPFDMEIP